MQATDLEAIILSLKLASITTLLLILLGTPLAWWLSRHPHPIKSVVSAIVTLPILLPPTVLGFYLLVFSGPDGFLGQLTESLGLGLLAFSFPGLVLASMIYSLPFVVQPLVQSFESINKRFFEAAATLHASPWDIFFHIALPLARPGFITAAILGFCHTIGEFGVVLLIGGNIPGKTQVLSMRIYEHVETLDYQSAHQLSLGMLAFALLSLFLVHRYTKR